MQAIETLREHIRNDRWTEAKTLLEAELKQQQPPSDELLACQTWILLYHAQELDAYPIVIQLLQKGYSDPEWLREVVLPLRHCLVCIANDPTLQLKSTRKGDARQQVLEMAHVLERWLEKHQVTLPEEPVGTRISLCMIARDDAEFLEECLKSVEGVVDEIVLVDTGSTDETPLIAQRYGAKVIQTEWRNDFAWARNIALQHATGDWVLILDADERLNGPKTRQALLEGARHPQYVGYYIEILNIVDFEQPDQHFMHRIVRFFRRLPYARWEGALHEQITPSLVQHGGRIATLVNAQILHIGYEKTILERKNKAQRNLDILYTLLQENPNDLFHLFNLANTYYTMGDYAQALPLLERVCKETNPCQDHMPHTWSIWVACLRHLGRPEEAIQAAEQAIESGIDYPGIYFEKAQAHRALQQYTLAYEALLEVPRCAMRIGLLGEDGETLQVGSGFVGDLTIVTYKWRHLIADTLIALGRLDEAEPYLNYLMRHHNHNPSILLLYADWLRLQNRFEEAHQVYEQLAQNPAHAPTAWRMIADLWWQKAHYARTIPALKNLCYHFPDAEEWWHRWVHASEQAHDFQSLVEAFEWRAQQTDSVSADMHINWGRALWQLRRYGEALHHFTHAIQIESTNPNALLNAGDALYQLGAYAEAADAYSFALELDPFNPQAWFTLGNCYARMQVYDAAKIAYQQALQLDPKHAQAQHNLEIVQEKIRHTAA